MAYIENIDFSILNSIHNTFSCAFLDGVMPLITSLGNRGIIWICAALLMMISPKYRRSGIILLAALAAGALFTNVLLKNLFARPRPCWIYQVRLLISMPGDYSFPSGHTASSFLSAVIIGHANRKFGLAAFILAFLIGFSRLYLYVHFPSDVLAGAVTGSLIGIAANKLTKRYIYP